MPRVKSKKKGGGGTKGIMKEKREEPNLANLGENDGDTGIDFEKLVKTEYMKRQREYRLMENTRHSLTGAGKSLSKQERLVELLRAERMSLATDLFNADSPEWQEVDMDSGHTLLSILEKLETALQNNDFCLSNIREMESHVDKITKLLISQGLKVQSEYGQSMTVPQADRRKKILENRLYFTTTRFDTKVSGNKGLREEIKMMLKLRGLFYRRHLAMKKKLESVRAKMTEVVFRSTHTYEQRDELVTSIRNIKDKNDKDMRTHILEIKEFHRILHNDAKVREFNMLKSKQRLMLESASQREARRILARHAEIEATLNSYNSSFKQILAVSNHDSLESLIKHYWEMEQANFARFIAISDHNHEVSILRRATEEMSKEIEDLFFTFRELEKSQTKESNELTEMLEKKKDELAQVSRVLEITEQSMGDTLGVMDALLKGTGCSDHSLLRLLGNDKTLHINPRNALLCMHSIETRGRELVLEKEQYDIRKAVEVDGIPVPRATGTPKTRPGMKQGGPYVPEVIVGGRVDDEDEEEDEEHGSGVLSAVEFRVKIIWKMQMKRDLYRRASSLPGSHVRASTGSSAGTIGTGT